MAAGSDVPEAPRSGGTYGSLTPNEELAPDNTADAERMPVADAERKPDLLATIRLVGASGVGLMADGYDLNVINLAMALMVSLYPKTIDAEAMGLMVSSTMAGVVIGMLSFGTIADMVGRKSASMCTALLAVVGALLSAAVTDSPTFGGMPQQLALCRFFLGLGIGGEYPLSAAIGTEVKFNSSASLACSRTQVLIANMMLFNLGAMLQASFVLLLLGTGLSLDNVWRVALAGGSVPSFVVLVLRTCMEEPEERQASVLAGNLASKLSSKKLLMASACICWALFNMVGYSLSSYSHVICEKNFPGQDDSQESIIRRDALYAILLSFVGFTAYVPLFLLDRLSARMLQMQGFAATMLLLVLASVLMPLSYTRVELTTYMLIQAGASVLGATTYLVPSDNFPSSIRGTCVGLAAASGKVGALIGTALFPKAVDELGLAAVLLIGSGITLLGLVATYIGIPSSPQSSQERKLFKD